MMDISKLYVTWNADDRLFIVENVDHPGLKTDGETVQEAVAEYYIALPGWLELKEDRDIEGLGETYD